MKNIVQQLICDNCKMVILEKTGEEFLKNGEFPITKEEAEQIDKKHRGHECHIEAVEKLQNIWRARMSYAPATRI